jgi:hypothetical protein
MFIGVIRGNGLVFHEYLTELDFLILSKKAMISIIFLKYISL